MKVQLLKLQHTILSILQWTVLFVLMLCVLVVAITQTNFGKKQILKYAQQMANEHLNAQLTIGQLDGNLVNSLTLTNLVLHQKSDTIATVESITLNYQLLDLIYNRITFNQIELNNPTIKLHQLPDSSWNIEHILKPDTIQKDTSSTPFDMLITVHEFSIINGNVKILSVDSLLPKRIESIDTRLAASYSTDSQHLNISSFNCKISHPDFIIKNFRAQITNTADEVLLDLMLKTNKNKAYLLGNYKYDNIQKSEITLTTNPLTLSEFAQWIPLQYQLKIEPKATIIAKIENKNLSANIKLETGKQSAVLAIQSEQLVKKLIENLRVKTPDYKLQLELTKLDLRDWLNDKSMNYVLNGTIDADATGNNLQDLKANVQAKLNNSIAQGIPMHRFESMLTYSQGNAYGNALLRGSFGRIYIKPQVKNCVQKNISYKVDARTEHLNLAPFVGKNYPTDITMKLSLNGNGIDPKLMNLKTLVLMNASKIMSFNIDTVYANINYIKQNIDLKSFFIKTLSSDLTATGNYNQRGASNLNVLLNIYNARELAALVGIDSTNTSGTIAANLYGLPKDLKADLLLKLDSSYYKSMYLNSLILNANATIKNKKIDIATNGRLNKINAAGYELDSVTMRGNTDLTNYKIQVQAANKDLQTHANANIKLSDSIRINLNDFGLNYKDYNWFLKQNDATITMHGNDFAINKLTLHSLAPDTIQSAILDGTFSTSGNENLTLKLQNMHLPHLYAFGSNDQKLKGKLSFNMQLGGTAQLPTFNGNFLFKDTEYDGYKLNQFIGNIHYDDNYLHTNTSLKALNSAAITFKSKLPVGLRIDSMHIETEKFKNHEQWAQLGIDSMPMAFANAFYHFDYIAGIANGRLNLSGSPAKPNLVGNFKLADGKLKIANYGIDYQNINSNIRFKERNILLDTIYINSKKGLITGNGNLYLGSNLFSPVIENANLKIGLDKFKPFDHRQFNMEVSGGINVTTAKDSARFDGELTIPETMIYLPAILKLMGKSAKTEIPESLLAQQLANDKLMSDSIVFRIEPDTSSINTDAFKIPFLKNMQGKIKLKIPRNMWIKNDDMRLELAGDLELMKHQDFFEIFGDISVLRGQYSLLGKVFVIKSGTISFEGGEEMNPRLDIEAQYNFRDDLRESHILTLLIGGNMYEPVFRFKYDDQAITEGDAISYLVFGTSLSAIGGQHTGGSDASELAKMAAASLLSSQLTKLLGNTLNMDYVEYRNKTTYDNASLVVGKYITNKLFISYEQNIGKIADDDVDRYNLRLEYELLKYLFFQLTSSSRSNGFDLIFKFDEKNNPFSGKKK